MKLHPFGAHLEILSNLLILSYFTCCIMIWITTLWLMQTSAMMMSSVLSQVQLAFMPPGDEMSEVVFCCLLHGHLGLNSLSKVITQCLGSDSKQWLLFWCLGFLHSINPMTAPPHPSSMQRGRTVPRKKEWLDSLMAFILLLIAKWLLVVFRLGWSMAR